MAAHSSDLVVPRPNRKMRLRWHEMPPREQLVWAAAYSQAIGVPGALAFVADKTVLSLRALGIDKEDPGPEYDLARTMLPIERNEFDPWYRVACQISRRPGSLSQAPSEEQCAAAYERYLRSRTDFY